MSAEEEKKLVEDVGIEPTAECQIVGCQANVLNARIEAQQRKVEILTTALSAAKGYMINAKIDLATDTKAAGAKTIEGGIKMIDAALSSTEVK